MAHSRSHDHTFEMTAKLNITWCCKSVFSHKIGRRLFISHSMDINTIKSVCNLHNSNWTLCVRKWWILPLNTRDISFHLISSPCSHLYSSPLVCVIPSICFLPCLKPLLVVYRRFHSHSFFLLKLKSWLDRKIPNGKTKYLHFPLSLSIFLLDFFPLSVCSWQNAKVTWECDFIFRVHCCTLPTVD